jgi:hypothetical protein
LQHNITIDGKICQLDFEKYFIFFPIFVIFWLFKADSLREDTGSQSEKACGSEYVGDNSRDELRLTARELPAFMNCAVRSADRLCPHPF